MTELLGRNTHLRQDFFGRKPLGIFSVGKHLKHSIKLVFDYSKVMGKKSGCQGMRISRVKPDHRSDNPLQREALSLKTTSCSPVEAHQENDQGKGGGGRTGGGGAP